MGVLWCLKFYTKLFKIIISYIDCYEPFISNGVSIFEQGLREDRNQSFTTMMCARQGRIQLLLL